MKQIRHYFILCFAAICGLLLCALFPTEFVAGGGGMELFPPATIKTDELTDIDLVVTATGGGGPIKGRYSNLTFHYKMEDGKDYNVVSAQPAVLPDNFKTVQSTSFQSEAYRFTIPAFPQGTAGNLYYFTETTFDGFTSRSEGQKPIVVSDTAKSSYDLKYNLSQLALCGRNYKANIITLEGLPITRRIIALIDKEDHMNGLDASTVCNAIRKLPENSQLRSSISDYDTKKLQYKVMLEVPFIIDLTAHTIYRLDDDSHFGKEMGSLH